MDLNTVYNTDPPAQSPFRECGLRPKLATSDLRQTVVVTESVANKIEVTPVVRFDMKMSLACGAGC
jgi:hypothetical protein